MAVDICAMGRCNSNGDVEGFSLEGKTYSGEESNMLMRESFSKSMILRGAEGLPPLEGETDTTGSGSFVTFHDNVIDKKRFKSDTLRVQSRSRATDGRRMDQCGFNPTKLIDNQIDHILIVQEAGIEESFCVKQLLPTYKGAAMKRAAAEGWESPWLSLEVEFAMLKKAREDFDNHAFMGDYGSGDSNRTHTDGWIKDIVLGMGAVQLSKGTWTFSGDLTDTCIEYRIGGVDGSVPFNTNMTTTLADFVTEITATGLIVDHNGDSLFSAVTSDATHIVITMVDGYDVEHNVRLTVTNCDGFTVCEADGLLAPVTPVTDASVSFVLTTKGVFGDQPISFDFEPITTTNVEAKFDGMYEEILRVKPEILADPNFTVFVAPNVFGALALARKNVNIANVGATLLPTQLQVWNGTRVQQVNQGMLPNNMIFGAAPKSLHVGTYLKNDMQAIRTYIRPMCDDMDYKSVYHMGFKTTNRSEIIGTFTDAALTLSTRFGTVQPDPFDA